MPLNEVAQRLNLQPSEYAETQALLATAQRIALTAGYALDHQAQLGLAAHLASLLRRLARGEQLTGFDPNSLNQVPEAYHTLATQLLAPIYQGRGLPLDPLEVGLVALHFGAAHERALAAEQKEEDQ